jgi:hypothetical protein
MNYITLIHRKVAPALAVMAELAISEANLAMTAPFSEGLMKPHIVAMFPAVKDVALLAAGML